MPALVYCKNCQPIPWRDSTSRAKAPISSVAGGVFVKSWTYTAHSCCQHCTYAEGIEHMMISFRGSCDDHCARPPGLVKESLSYKNVMLIALFFTGISDTFLWIFGHVQLVAFVAQSL
jgi:hypothetical protein